MCCFGPDETAIAFLGYETWKGDAAKMGRYAEPCRLPVVFDLDQTLLVAYAVKSLRERVSSIAADRYYPRGLPAQDLRAFPLCHQPHHARFMTTMHSLKYPDVNPSFCSCDSNIIWLPPVAQYQAWGTE